MNHADVRLTVTHDNRQRVVYRYRTADYARLPQALRDYDAQLFDGEAARYRPAGRAYILNLQTFADAKEYANERSTARSHRPGR